jgi:formate dehydrogenase major subunit
MIVVDPRFTRTAANADLFLQIRAGTDIAFLGGLINYAIANNRLAHDYLLHYTNASFIVHEGFKLPEDGLYSGFDPESHLYDMTTWNYEAGGRLTEGQVAAAPKGTASGGGASAESTAQPNQPSGAPPTAKSVQALTGLGYAAQGPSGGRAGSSGSKPGGTTQHVPPALPANVAYDPSLQHPRCVFQLLKQQYSRYTPEMVERITGIPKDQFLKAADLFTSIRKDGDTKHVATIIYAVGWTQHTFGTQIIRAAAML